MQTLLSTRTQSLGIRSIAYTIVRHPRRDPGVRTEAHELLRGQAERAARALVVLDRAGSGSSDSPSELERDIKAKLARSGWDDRCAVVVVDPELEAWVWARSPHVARILGWNEPGELRDWLQTQGVWPQGSTKPSDPELALKTVLRRTGRGASPALFGELAARVGLSSCQDAAFARFCDVLRGWFGQEAGS